MFSQDNKICACSFSSRARGLPFSAHCRGFLLMIFTHRGSFCCNTKTGQNLPQLKKKSTITKRVEVHSLISRTSLIYTKTCKNIAEEKNSCKLLTFLGRQYFLSKID